MENNEVLTPKEVAGRLKCSLTTVYEMCESGVLKSFKLIPGSRRGIRIVGSSLDTFINGKGVEDFSPAPVSRMPASKKVKLPRGRHLH